MPSADEIRHRCRRVVSPVTGIINTIQYGSVDEGDPQVFLAASRIANTRVFNRFEPLQKYGGIGLTFEDAYVTIIGETLERYCPGFYDDTQFLRGAFREFPEIAVCPDRFALFSDQQYQSPGFLFSRFTEESQVNWVRGYSLTEGREVLVPAPFVYIPYRVTEHCEKITYQSTNGLACHWTYTQAILTGLFEVIERDSFAITWLNKLPVPLLESNGDGRPCLFSEKHRDVFLLDHLECKAFDITLDLPVPASMVFLKSCQGSCGDIVTMGCSSRFIPAQSLLKSLLEASHGRAYTSYLLMKHSAWQPADDFSDITDFDKHFMLYNKKRELRTFIPYMTVNASEGYPTRLLRDDDRVNATTRSPIDQLQVIVDKLRQEELEVIVIDVTTDDVRDAGFVVVRVLVPGLVPLTGNHTIRFLGGSRLRTVPVKLQYREREPSDEELFPFPHPSA